MECLRRQTAEERGGALWCHEEGCKQRPGSLDEDGRAYQDPSEANCLLQLQLRAGDAEGDLRAGVGSALEDVGRELDRTQLFGEGFIIDPTLGPNQIRIGDSVIEYTSEPLDHPLARDPFDALQPGWLDDWIAANSAWHSQFLRFFGFSSHSPAVVHHGRGDGICISNLDADTYHQQGSE